MKVSQLASILGLVFEGNGDTELTAAGPLETAGPTELSFLANPKAAALARRSNAGCLILSEDTAGDQYPSVIRAANPRMAFAAALECLHPRPVAAPGIHPTATVHPTADVHPSASIGAYVSIGENSVIGAQCILHPRVTLYDHVTIGSRVILHSGVVLGADGFGFVFDRDHYQKFPQVGRVIIGHDVEIGANSCVDRAALGATQIGDGTKLDNLVHIGHNCKIGKHVVIAAQTGLSGGVTVGDYAVIGGQVGVGDKARIESRAVIGSKAGILPSKIVRAGEPQWGIPARPLKEHLRSLAYIARASRK